MRVRVSDRGVGIPQAQLRRIFRRFHRFQWRGYKVKGTGLGLYIVRSIVRRHGGRVSAASDGEGRGSTFTIELPRNGAELNGAPAGGRGRAPPRQGLCFNLEADGHEVDVAGDGETALASLSAAAGCSTPCCST